MVIREPAVRWRRRREQSWWLFGLSVALAVAGAVAAWSKDVAEDVEVSPWVLLALAVLSAVGALVLKRLEARAKDIDQQAAAIDHGSVGAEAGQFRTVGEWKLPELGVHAAQVDLPYLRRDSEQDLEAVLEASKPALVFGHSMSGKTRMTAEIIKRRYPDRRLWVPRAPDGVATLIGGGGMVAGAVVWLNDLDRYLAAPEHLHADWLDRLLAHGNVVVATIRAKELTTLSADVPDTAGQREVLERFGRVPVLDEEQERARHASEATNPDQARGIARYGVAVYVGAGYRAVARYLENLELHPLGTALVRAAADWRRMGLETIAESTLETLAPTYLPDRHRHDPKETLPDALGWASSDQSQVFRLLEPAGDRLWRAFDYILDYLSNEIDGRKPQPIPLPSWQLAATVADPQQQVAVATRAHSAGVTDIALALYRRLATSADPDLAAVAMRNVGFLLKERKDWEGAEQAWRDVIATGHPEQAPWAMITLGSLLHERGELAGAEQAYQDAIATGHRPVAPAAMVFLGDLLKARMDWEGAEQAYRAAIATGHGEHAAAAMLFLGDLLKERMDWKRMDSERAEQAYRAAIATGHPKAAPWAMVALGNFLYEGGDLAGAEQAYRATIATGNPEATARARDNLRRLRNFRS